MAKALQKSQKSLKKNQYDIFRGVQKNDLAEVENALREDPECINSQQEGGWKETPLIMAARQGRYHIVIRLLQQPGIDFTIKDSHNCDALEAAASVGHPGIMQEIGWAMFPETKELLESPEKPSIL